MLYLLQWKPFKRLFITFFKFTRKLSTVVYENTENWYNRKVKEVANSFYAKLQCLPAGRLQDWGVHLSARLLRLTKHASFLTLIFHKLASVTTRLKCDRIFNDHFIANFLSVNNFENRPIIWWIYEKKLGGVLFYSPCTLQCCYFNCLVSLLTQSTGTHYHKKLALAAPARSLVNFC